MLISRGLDARSFFSVPNRKKFYSVVFILTFSVPLVRFVYVLQDEVRLLEVDFCFSLLLLLAWNKIYVRMLFEICRCCNHLRDKKKNQN